MDEESKRATPTGASGGPKLPTEPEDISSKIMTRPLPQILEEIAESIVAADAAALNAREAADEARKAGEKAASEAKEVAAREIARVEQVANEALQLARLIRDSLKEMASGIEKRLSDVSQD